MNKILDKIIRSEYAPSNKNVVWDDGKEFKTYEKGKWKSKGGGGGNGVPIVDSVDKLDASAEVGSVACVAVQGTSTEKPFAEYVRATSENVDMSSGIILTDGLDIIKGISIKAPTELIECTESSELMACTENVNIMSPTDGFIAGFGVDVKTHSETQKSYISQYVAYYADVTTMQQVQFTLMDIAEDGTATIHEDAILEFNNFLSSNELYFLGPFNKIMNGQEVIDEDFYFIDMLSSGLQGTSSTARFFIKKDNWEELYASDISSLLKQLENKENLIPLDEGYSFIISPGTCYIRSWSSMYDLSFNLKNSGNNIYEEFLLQITFEGNTAPAVINFYDGTNLQENTPYPIKWANGVAPVPIAGTTMFISIANGLGVYSTFPNS